MKTFISKIVQAYREGCLFSRAMRRLKDPLGNSEIYLRYRLGLPAANGSDLPAIVMSGDFSRYEGRALNAALKAAVNDRGKLPAKIRAINGLSGQRYRTLVNALIGSLDHARYLEIGSWLGSTAAAAMYGNSVNAVCIDNWSKFGGSRDKFLSNIMKAKPNGSDVKVLGEDFRRVDYHSLGKFNVYLFDGPHSRVDQRDAILVVQPCLEDPYILIVDDWNWAQVRIGTMNGLRIARHRVESAIQIRTTFDETQPSNWGGSSEWHNGYFIAVIRKIKEVSTGSESA